MLQRPGHRAEEFFRQCGSRGRVIPVERSVEASSPVARSGRVHREAPLPVHIEGVTAGRLLEPAPTPILPAAGMAPERITPERLALIEGFLVVFAGRLLPLV